jgi:hypothetical protein
LETDMTEPGFCPPRVRALGVARFAELIATVALTVSTLAVAVAVAHACV